MKTKSVVHPGVLRLLVAGIIISGALFCAGLQAQTILVPTNAVWRYLDDGSDQGSAWRAPGFLDGDWNDGPAELGFGDAMEGRPEATLLEPGSPAGFITYYFRHHFEAENVASVTSLVARVMRDDGAVIYLNGFEVGRTGMPEGPVDFETLAAEPGAIGDEEFTFFELELDPELLAEGPNIIAVEVHQLTTTSPDLSFALELVVRTNAPPPDNGQTLIVPPSIANVTTAFGAGTLSAANHRIQEVYGAINFPPDTAMWITELRYRPDLFAGHAFNTTVNSIQINLSTTPRSPDALSPNYGLNVGLDDTIVFNGLLQISSQFTGLPGGPRDFDIRIPLTTPFLYDPSVGNLLIDFRNFSGSGASPLSGQAVGGDNASRVAGGLGLANGGLDTGIDALQIVFTLTNPPPPPPPRLLLLRGPYLQIGTQTNMLVCWRTSLPTNSLARFGLTANALNWEARSQGPTNNHCLVLTNLLPGTKYFYSVGATDTNLAFGTNFYFITAPKQAKPTRIWALGDCGTASQPFETRALRVRDAYLAYTGSRETDVWLMLGDNAYGSGTDSEYQSAVFDVYQTALRRWPLWSTIGNHETYAPLAGQAVAYWDIFRLPMQGEAGGVPSGTERYYSFNYGNIHFLCLDSETAFTNNSGADMLQWLQADLDDNTNEWIIAFWHSPPYTKGSHNSDSLTDSEGRMIWMREQVCPILESNGVDLVLCGHSHNYERSYLMYGHYGFSQDFLPSMILDNTSGRPAETGPYHKPDTGPQANLGTVYIVAGSSGWTHGLQPDWPHPVMFRTLLNLGSMVIDVDGPRLDAGFLRETGAIDDSFAIIKSTSQAPTVIGTFRVANGFVTARFNSVAGRHYRIMRSPQLEQPVWSPASDVFEATGHRTTWIGPAPQGAERSFYRVQKMD